ncbi:MAG: hypothetical protein WD009_01940 [Phycisphaeraceae bacterium]
MPRNPFKPGAGHMPPYLAGRDEEKQEFVRSLKQDVILDNLVLTGLRGVGKTVLADTFKPLALDNDWLWASSDLSEAISVSEERLCVRIITDLAVAISSITVETAVEKIGFAASETQRATISFEHLLHVYSETPGLSADKLKAVLEYTWPFVQRSTFRGVVFAYDEAQNLGDNPANGAYPLSLLLDVFQSIQKKGMRFLLVLVGLPTLFPKLVEARTFSERMFHVVQLGKLKAEDAKDAIVRPIDDLRDEHPGDPPVRFTDDSIDLIVHTSGGYPYFIQFICREVFDIFILQQEKGDKISVPSTAIISKLDADFFAGRWSRVTDRQRVLLWIVAHLNNCESDFTIQDIVQKSAEMNVKPFSNSHANQILTSLCKSGLIYKTPRHGKYQFAVPLLSEFIKRQEQDIPAETS